MSGPASTPGAASPHARYEAHLKAGELAYQYSPTAQRAVFYPRVLCPYSGSDVLQWRISAGRGTVYSTSVVHPRQGEPFNVALIDLDEGFRMMSRVQADDPMTVAIGQRVMFKAVDQAGESPLPVFFPMEPTDEQ